MTKSTRQKISPSEASLWMGMDFMAWMRLLCRNRFAIRPAKWPQVCLITLVSLVNTFLRCLETIYYGTAVRKIDVGDDPVFIIGHWRTGTTMLHELLALDSRHRCPTTYECLSPNHFLLSERIVRRLASWLLPRTRPFDNMKMSFDRPQEDEAALSLRGQPSPFLTVAFPKRPIQDSSYITLDELSERDLSAWKERMFWFLRLLLYKKQGRLVLKSPQHTFRLPTLLAMFPRAKFIYLVRDPYVVFSSTVHFWSTMYEIYGLQTFDRKLVEEQVLSNFAQMHERMEATREQLAPDQLYELRYEDLVANPVEQLDAIYKFLETGDFATVRPEVERYAQRSQRYRTNEYELNADSRATITRRWAAFIKQYGYANSELPASPSVFLSSSLPSPGSTGSASGS